MIRENRGEEIVKDDSSHTQEISFLIERAHQDISLLYFDHQCYRPEMLLEKERRKSNQVIYKESEIKTANFSTHL